MKKLLIKDGGQEFYIENVEKGCGYYDDSAIFETYVGVEPGKTKRIATQNGWLVLIVNETSEETEEEGREYSDAEAEAGAEEIEEFFENQQHPTAEEEELLHDLMKGDTENNGYTEAP